MKTIIVGITLLMSTSFLAHTSNQQHNGTTSSFYVKKGDDPTSTLKSEKETIEQILIDRQITESAEESMAPLQIDYTIWDKMADDQAIIEQLTKNEVYPLQVNVPTNNWRKHKKQHHCQVKFNKTIKN